MSQSEPTPSPDSEKSAFERAAEEAPASLVGEFIDFLKHNKKWWLIPILVTLGLIGILILFSGTAAAPFIYTLF